MILVSEYMRFSDITEKNKKLFSSRHGMSLIEIVVYVGLLAAISVLVSSSLIQIANVYQRMRTEREVLSNARIILDTLTRNIAQAKGVYAPTSNFDNDAGQLSLASVVGAQPGHTTAYVDFWLDNGLFLSRTEGGIANTLSASSVRVKIGRAHV